MKPKDFELLVKKLSDKNKMKRTYPWDEIIGSVEIGLKKPIELDFVKGENVLIVKADRSQIMNMDASKAYRILLDLLKKGSADKKLNEKLVEHLIKAMQESSLITEELDDSDREEIKDIIRAEIANVMFDLFRKRSVWV